MGRAHAHAKKQLQVLDLRVGIDMRRLFSREVNFKRRSDESSFENWVEHRLCSRTCGKRSEVWIGVGRACARDVRRE